MLNDLEYEYENDFNRTKLELKAPRARGALGEFRILIAPNWN